MSNQYDGLNAFHLDDDYKQGVVFLTDDEVRQMLAMQTEEERFEFMDNHSSIIKPKVMWAAVLGFMDDEVWENIAHWAGA